MEANPGEHLLTRGLLTFNLTLVYLLVSIFPVGALLADGRRFQAAMIALGTVAYLGIPFLFRWTRRLEPPALTFAGVGFALLLLNNYFDEGELTMMSALWGTTLLVYTYLALGRGVGFAFTGAYIAALTTFEVLPARRFTFPPADELTAPPEPPFLMIVIPVGFLCYTLWEHLRLEHGTRHRLEQAIAEKSVLNHTLREKLELLRLQSDDLRQAKHQAEANARARQDFLSQMSHEIRTPLNGVIGLTDLLLEDAPKPEQCEHLESLRFSAESLLGILNNVLDFSKLDEGKMTLNLEPCQLRSLLRSCVSVWKLNGDKKGVDVRWRDHASLPDWIETDAPKLTQILNNLLSNALRFTERGSITVAVTAGEAQPDSRDVVLTFEITDTGIGIEPDRLDRVFDAFYQAEKRAGALYGGTGLGLAIVKHLVQLLGGTIRVSSWRGQGTTFTFDIAARRADPLITAADGAEPAHLLTGKTILLVEDNATNRLVANRQLQRLGVRIVEASDGAEAMTLLHDDHGFDLVLLDLQMPQVDGHEVLRWMRSHRLPYLRKVQVIALTATALADVREDVLREGANGFVTKPFKARQLVEALAGAIAASPSVRET